MPVVVEAYDPEWPGLFEAERVLLERVLAPWLEGGIHHIGSTAVPGLAAKPIIDMLAGVRDFAEARQAYDRLAEIGYVHEPHRAGIAHHFARRAPDGRTTHGLHLTEPGSDLWRERLVFRDALRADPDLAAEYEALKLTLVRDEVDDYTGSKRPFVADVLARFGLQPGRR
ncbi:MAG: GrpB family protein [Gaiellaceae bacterium]